MKRRPILINVCCAIAVCAVSGARETLADEKQYSEQQYNHVLAFASCAPWDGAALRLAFFSSPEACDTKAQPAFELSIWRMPSSGLDLLLDARQPTASGGPTGSGFLRTHEVVRINPASRVRFMRVNDKRIEGAIDLLFGDRIERGTFVAARCPQVALCG